MSLVHNTIDRPPRKQTQEELILECLRYYRGSWVSVYDIETYLFNRETKARQIPARIFYLKKTHNIEGRYRKFPEYEYRLVENE